MTIGVSRFVDGSTSISAAELRRDWPEWTPSQRRSFVYSCPWLADQADFPEMLRFIARNGGAEESSGIALHLAARLPRDEAFDILVAMLDSAEHGRSANIAQAIATTKHSRAEPTLRRHFDAVWENRRLWEDDELINMVACDAAMCIGDLIELGASPADFEAQVVQLSRHACPRNRDYCRRGLAKQYPWLAGWGKTDVERSE
jgi:hypothetical protein